MKTVGFLGLGMMGRPMAINIAKGGFDTCVYDINPDVIAECLDSGAKAAGGYGDIAKCDIICLCLPSSAIVEAALYGETGLLALMERGKILIDFSTIFYETTVKINEEAVSRGIRFLDAPVSGMHSRAVDGSLTVMCGGDSLLFEEVKPLLACVGSKILHMGKSGLGQLTKLINQLLFDINAAALAEILPMAAKMGLDPDNVGEVVNSGTGRSYASEFFIPRILKNVFNEGYPMERAYKDLVSAAQLGAAKGIPLPILGTATATYQQALLRGYGPLDKGAMIKVFEELHGLEFRSRAQKD